MKKWIFLTMMGTFNFVYGSHQVTVQVISAVQEKSITDAFDAKLKKTGLEIYKKREEGKFIVTLGEFKDSKKAQPALMKARTIVNKEAFIRPVDRNTSDTTVSSVSTVDSNISAIAVESSKHVTPAPILETAAIAVSTTIVPTVLVASPSQKREMRKDEISSAIDYYTNSPYYRFEPVILRQ
jgi:hypothetical protein